MTAQIVEHFTRTPRRLDHEATLAALADGDVTRTTEHYKGTRADGELWERLGSARGPSRPRWIACAGRRIQHVSMGSIIWTSAAGSGGVAWDAPDPRSGERSWVPFRPLA